MAPGAIKSDTDQETVAAKDEKNNGKAQFNASTVELQSKGSSAGAKEGIGGGKTFARQHELPRLPIPKLEDTCHRYLTSLQPLQVRIPPPHFHCTWQKGEREREILTDCVTEQGGT